MMLIGFFVVGFSIGYALYWCASEKGFKEEIKNLKAHLDSYHQQKYELMDRIETLQDSNRSLALDLSNNEKVLKDTLDMFDRSKERIKELESMPLIKGPKAKTKSGISENIRREKKAHPEMPVKQAAAIAYSTARGGKTRKEVKKK